MAAVLPLIGILPSFGGGVIDTADGPLHVQRIFALATMLGEGNLYPRWVPYFHLGFGYPIFNYYPPGVFYLSGILVNLGVHATVAFNIVAALAWVLGSLGTYALGRRLLPARVALLGAALWAYAPSRLFEVWDQGSLPQMMAAALVPWLFLGLLTVAVNPTRRGLLALALPLAGIIFSHQPITFITALYVAPAALIVPLWAAWRYNGDLIRRYLHVFGGLALGGCLAAIYLLPVAFELRYVQAAGGADDNIAYLISNFLQPREIFMLPPPADLTDLRYELPTTLGLVGGVLSGLGFIALLVRRRFVLATFLAVGLGFTLFMLIEPSLPVWLGIPLFRQLRFPERFLRVGALLIALAGSASLLLLPRRWQTVGLSIGLLVVIVAALPLVYPNQGFVNWDNLSARSEIEFELEHYTWGTTSYDEFDPIWGDKIPLPLDGAPENDEYVNDPLRIVVNRVNMARDGDVLRNVEQLDTATVRVTVTEAYPLRFHQYYFPGWSATVNGQPADIYPGHEFGLITVDLPAGEHVVSLAYVGTTVQQISTVVTLAAVGVVVLIVFLTGPRAGLPLVNPYGRLTSSAATRITAAIIAFALVNTLVIAPGTRWFRYESPPGQPALMQTPLNVSFGGEFMLLGYTLEQTTAAPGERLDVTLFWRAEREITRNYRPVVHLVNRTRTEAWAVSEPFFPGGGSTKGYPRDRFASEVHELRVFPTADPYIGRIFVQMVDVETGEPLMVNAEDDFVLLDPVIRMTGSDNPRRTRPDQADIIIGDVVQLGCAELVPEAAGYTLNLYLHVLRTPAEELIVFAHGLDAAGELIVQRDGPLFDDNYPSVYWRHGQNLIDTRRIPADPTLEQVAVGLYTRADTARLPLTVDGERQPADALLLPLDGESCQR